MLLFFSKNKAKINEELKYIIIKKYGIEYIDKDWNKHSHLLYRFSDEEEVGLPFRYADKAPWGIPLSRDQIKEAIIQVQTWGRENGMLY